MLPAILSFSVFRFFDFSVMGVPESPYGGKNKHNRNSIRRSGVHDNNNGRGAFAYSYMDSNNQRIFHPSQLVLQFFIMVWLLSHLQQQSQKGLLLVTALSEEPAS